eukprot:9281832-Alexandrium_andersonii.AAC.1
MAQPAPRGRPSGQQVAARPPQGRRRRPGSPGAPLVRRRWSLWPRPWAPGSECEAPCRCGG